MTKCSKCGTGWTSQGLPICPICGTKVEDPAAPAPAAAPAGRCPVMDSPPLMDFSRNGGSASAVLEAPAEPPKIQIQKVEPVRPIPVVKETVPMIEPPAEPRRHESRRFDLLQGADPSALAIPAAKELPAPSRPLNGPLILGALSYVGVLLLPLTVAFEHHRVLGVLGFCMTGFFAPFAPIAWMVGLTAEKRRRDQGLRAENRVSLGRLLGQWGTMILVSELTVALVAIAALRLSGRFPITFWAPLY